MNRIIEQFMHAFVHHHPLPWGKFLPWVEWSYNTSRNTSTGTSPFEVTYGNKPSTILQYITSSSSVEAVDTLLTTWEAVFDSLRHKLLKVKAQMKHFANNKHPEVHYAKGDWAMVKLHPLRQSSLTGPNKTKLAKRFYGPFKVLECISTVAYVTS